MPTGIPSCAPRSTPAWEGWSACRVSGLRGSDAGPERRRLRRGGGRHPDLCACSTGTPANCAGGTGRTRFGYRTSVLKHPARGCARRSPSRSSSPWMPLNCSAPLRYGELTRHSVRSRGSALTRPASAPLSWRVAPRQGHGDRRVRTTTPGVSGRSSPTPSSAPIGSISCSPATVPCRTSRRTRGEAAAGWLVGTCRIFKGFPGPDAPARLSTWHALALTSTRGTATSADVIALARRVRATVASTFGVEPVPEPVILGAGLDLPGPCSRKCTAPNLAVV